MFNIIKTNEPITINSINILVYGEPGAGKTSLVNTASNPLSLDFDKGAHRSDFRKDVLVVDSWKNLNDNIAGLFTTFNSYETIILDTVDTLLDYMGAWIISLDPKLARNKLQFYGKLKDEFTSFIGRLKTIGKDVVMVAHVREKDEGDIRIKRPAITGGSYDRVLQISDFVGYLYIKNNQRFIDFNPTDYWIGKNSAKFEPLLIPNFNTSPDFFANIINEMKSALNRQAKAQTETLNLLKEYSSKIQNLNTLSDINGFFSELSNKDLANGVKKQVWDKLTTRAKELNFQFNKDEKVFYVEETKRDDSKRDDSKEKERDYIFFKPDTNKEKEKEKDYTFFNSSINFD